MNVIWTSRKINWNENAKAQWLKGKRKSEHYHVKLELKYVKPDPKINMNKIESGPNNTHDDTKLLT